MAACQIFDFVFTRFETLGLSKRPGLGRTACILYLALSIVAFQVYSPLAYGNMWTKNECKRVKVLGTWDWDCNVFLDSVTLHYVF